MADNGKNKRVFEFDVGDAPVLKHALQIAVTTAMMCGNGGAKERLKTYLEFMKQFVPDGAELFGEEEWCEICMALMSGVTEFVVRVQPSQWRERDQYWWSENSEGEICVHVGPRHWRTNSWKFQHSGSEVQTVLKTLNEYAPTGVEGRIELWAPLEARVTKKNETL